MFILLRSFLGRTARPPELVQKWLERAKKDWLGILVVVRLGAVVTVPVCRWGLWFELLPSPREKALRLSS